MSNWWKKYEKGRDEVEKQLKGLEKSDLRAFLDWIALKPARSAAVDGVVESQASVEKEALCTFSSWLSSS